MMTPNRAARGVSSALAMLGVAAALHAQPVVLYVDDDAPAGGDGSTWQQAFRDLQDALAVANAVEQGSFEIRIAEGVYRPDRGTLDRGATFQAGPTDLVPASAISLGVGLFGGFVGLRGSDPDVRDPDRFVTVLSGDLQGDDGPDWTRREDNSVCVVRSRHLGRGFVLDGLTITGGHVPANGYAEAAGVDIYERGGYFGPASTTGTLRNCRVVGNDVLGFAWAAGGAIHARGVLIENTLIADNSVRGSFGPYSPGVGVGGIKSVTSNLDTKVRNSRFVRNHGIGAGGGYFSGAPGFVACEFVGNTAAGMGGGLYCEAMAQLQNCLFAGNSADQAGGGYCTELHDAQVFGGFEARIIGCTFVANESAYGGAVFAEAYKLQIANTILWDNRAAFGPSLVFDRPGMEAQVRDSLVQGGGSGVYGLWSSLDWLGVLDTDPLFRDAAGPDGDPMTWQDNDYHLLISSPCIDAGDPEAYWGQTDLDGAPRAVDSDPSATRPRPDLGAYEVQDPWCPADFNGDGFVDGIDYDRFAIDFDTGSPRADVNRDGYVDGIDYDQFAIWFDSGC